MDRGRDNSKTDIIFALIVLVLCGLTQAESVRVLGKFRLNDEANIQFLAISSYAISFITPFALAFLVFIILIYSIRISGAEYKTTRIFVVVGFSFLPFLINSTALYAFIAFSSKIEHQLSNPDFKHVEDIYLTDVVKLSHFANLGTISSGLFLAALIYQLAYVEKYLKPILAAAVVLCPILLIYLFKLLIGLFL
jgi:hypothetical protein